MSGEKKTLYERLGGYDAITAVANDLLPPTLSDHFKSGQLLSVQNRPTEVAVPGLSCSTLPFPIPGRT